MYEHSKKKTDSVEPTMLFVVSNSCIVLSSRRS